MEKEQNENIHTPDLHDFTENSVHSYVKLSDKYNDVMSSATTMIFVGIAGLIFMLLLFTGILSIPLNPDTSWLFQSVMLILFVAFTVFGFISLFRARQLKSDAQKEDVLIADILAWSDEHLSAAAIDRDLDLTQPEELLFFNRADQIKDALMHQFETADEPLLEEMTEQIYQKLYESEQTLSV